MCLHELTRLWPNYSLLLLDDVHNWFLEINLQIVKVLNYRKNIYTDEQQHDQFLQITIIVLFRSNVWISADCN